MAAEPSRLARLLGDRVLGLALAVLLVVLALTLLVGWVEVRKPRMQPVGVPTLARA